MEGAVETNRGSTLWIGLLTAASAVTTLAIACATPFAALAAIAATRMRTRDGLLLMALAWATSQAIGFGVLNYPHDPRTLAWGFAMLTAALVAVTAARWAANAAPAANAIVVIATAFGAGFVGYKLTMLVWSFGLGGVHTAASPYWTAWQFGREAAVLVGLIALYHVLTAIGVPKSARNARA